MKNLKKYLKYYFLETNYLLDEVTKKFRKNHALTAEEFFAIVIWKRNPSKTKILQGIKKSKKTIHKITSEVFGTKKLEDKLKILTEILGIGVSMASAILTICYPDKFTVVDYHALASLKKFRKKINGNPTAKIYPYTAYFDYLYKCIELADRYNLSLRDFDRILWAMDFYKGKNGLKYLVKGLD